MKQIEMFNWSLLGKWLWRALRDQESVWGRILRARYGPQFALLNVHFNLSKMSIWWNDIRKVGGLASSWFSNGVKKVLGDGRSIQFWTAT